MAESSTGKNEEKYSIDTELSSGNVKFLPEFLKRNFLLQQEKYREFRRKIGFRRLFPLYLREPGFKGYRRAEWLRFDPHPPAYYRIANLESLKEPEKIEHTFLRTVKDNIKGFLRA